MSDDDEIYEESTDEIAEEIWGRPTLGSLIDSGRSLGRFAPCKGQWDTAKRKYVNLQGIDVVECCINSCRPRALYCHNQCTNNLRQSFGDAIDQGILSPEEAKKRCRSSCEAMTNLCLTGCKAAAPGFNNDNEYFACAYEQGCKSDVGGIPDPSCTNRHQKEILGCCLAKCQPTSDTDCDAYCQFLRDRILDPESVGIRVGWGGRMSSTVNKPDWSPATSALEKHEQQLRPRISTETILTAKLTKLNPSEIRAYLRGLPTTELEKLSAYLGNMYYDYTTTSGEVSGGDDNPSLGAVFSSQQEIDVLGQTQYSHGQLSYQQFQAVSDVLRERQPEWHGLSTIFGQRHDTKTEHQKLDEELEKGKYRTYPDATGRNILVAISISLLLIASFLLWRRWRWKN